MVGRLLSDAGQGVHQGEVGQWRVGGDARGQINGLGQGRACGHQVLRQAHAFAVLRVVHATRQHHVGHAGRANQFGHAHRTATADKNAACAFGQCVEGAVIGHANMAGTGQLQTATDHSAVQGGDDRHAALLDRVQCHVPAARVVNAFAGVTLFEFGQIEPGAKVVTLSVDHGSAGLGRQILKHITQRFNQAVVQGVALGGAAQTHHGHGALHLQRNAMGCGAVKNRRIQISHVQCPF